MRVINHQSLFGQGLLVWALFWLAGLPGYYQQYPPVTMAVGCVLLSVAISFWALRILLRGRPDTKLRRAVWISFYFTVPFAVLDWLYCGVHLRHGMTFLARYWYLTVFYFTPWLTLVPTAWLLRREQGARR